MVWLNISTFKSSELKDTSAHAASAKEASSLGEQEHVHCYWSPVLWSISARPWVSFTRSSVPPLTQVKLWSNWATSPEKRDEISSWLYLQLCISKDKCSKSITDICKNWRDLVLPRSGRVPESLTVLRINTNWIYTFTAYFLQLPLRFILPENQQLATCTFSC